MICWNKLHKVWTHFCNWLTDNYRSPYTHADIQRTFDLSSIGDHNLSKCVIIQSYTSYFLLIVAQIVFLIDSGSDNLYSLYYTGVDVDLPYLMTALQPVYDWFNLGVYLGVPHATLMKIKIEQREGVEDCKREMLVAWLRSSEAITKHHLMKALWNITHTQTVSDTRTCQIPCNHTDMHCLIGWCMLNYTCGYWQPVCESSNQQV